MKTKINKVKNVPIRWFYKKGESNPTLQYCCVIGGKKGFYEVWADIEKVYEDGWFEKDQEGN